MLDQQGLGCVGLRRETLARIDLMTTQQPSPTSPTSPPQLTSSCPLERVAACDLCGGTSYRKRHEWKDLLLFGPERWDLVTCDDCALGFLHPRPTREAIGGFYPQDYPAHHAPMTQPKPWHRRISSPEQPALGLLRRALIQIRQDLSWYYFPRWRGRGDVLDVGCGSGGRYLDILKALGWTTHGLDPSDAAVAGATAKGHVAQVGTAEEQLFGDHSMDVVTIWHVLEHTHSPQRALEACYRTLRPGGLLSLCVPNYAGLQAKLFRRYWWSCDAPRHLFQFTRRTLGRYLEEAGFTNVKITTRSGPTSLQRAARHFLNDVFRTRWSRDSSLAVNLLHPATVFGSVVRFFGMGSELRVLAERPQ